MNEHLQFIRHYFTEVIRKQCFTKVIRKQLSYRGNQKTMELQR